MDSLPLEIVSQIVDILSFDYPTDLRLYATISNSWQSAIEQRTFQSLSFNMAEIEAFHLMFNSYKIYRAGFLLKLTIELGSKSKAEDTNRNETEEASKAASLLILALADISTRATNTLPLTLILTDCTWNDGTGLADIILSKLDPFLYDIRSLEGAISTAWKPRALLSIACKLRGLERLELMLYDRFEFGRRKRTLLRKEISDAFCNLDVSRLHTLILGACHYSPQDEDWDAGSLLPKNGSHHDTYVRIYQHLSISPNLRILRLVHCHVIGVDLFANMPEFPSLVEFELEFSAETAEGQWFFVNDGRFYESEREQELEFVVLPEEATGEYTVRPIITFEDSDDEDGPLEERNDKVNRYRTLPNPEIIPKFLSEAAEFVQAHPMLRMFLLGTKYQKNFWNEDDMDRFFEVWFLRSGTTRCSSGRFNWARVPAEEKILNWNRLYWRVGDRWRPDEAVLQSWRNATGPDTKVLFLDENRWDDRDPRSIYRGDLEKELCR